MALFHIYADESRQTGHSAMLYGMVILPARIAVPELDTLVTGLRENHRFGAEEIKWSSVSKSKLDMYKSVIDAFFSSTSASFRCMKIEHKTIDRHKYHESNFETAFYWGYGMALSRNLEMTKQYEIFLDARTDEKPNRLSDLKSTINAHWIQQQLAQNINPNEIVRDIKAVDSKKYNILQIVDLLLGAVGFALESLDKKSNASETKIALVKHIASAIGCDTLTSHHGIDSRFNIWNFRFRTEEE